MPTAATKCAARAAVAYACQRSPAAISSGSCDILMVRELALLSCCRHTKTVRAELCQLPGICLTSASCVTWTFCGERFSICCEEPLYNLVLTKVMAFLS